MIFAKNEQSLEHAFAGTRVKRGNHQVASQGGTDGDVRGFFVANFANDEDLRILAKEVTRGLREIEAARLVHLSLHHTRNDLFGGVFDRNDVTATVPD